jgi:sugar lactone lactonase YvrE
MRRLVPATVLALAATILMGGSIAGVATAAPPGAAAARSAAASTAVGAASAQRLFPRVIPLPDGFRPEGVTTGRGASFYAGSLVDGAIFRGDVVTGRGSVLVPGVAGRAATGLEVDARNRLFASGAGTGAAHVYDARTGAELASYQFVASGAGFINDVVVTSTAAYFTDSLNPVLYVLPFGPGGRLPAAGRFRTLPLSGDLVFQDGFNTNGIETTPDGRRLIVVQSNTGQLFAVPPGTGVARRIDLGGALLTNGDGLLRRGRTLYAVQNQNNQVAVVRLDRQGNAGTVTGAITDPALDVPTTVGAFGPFLYAVNARFNTPPTPTTTYTVVRLPAR